MTTTPTSGAADLPEATATLIERLEDAVYEWGNYVDADHAPCPLTRHVDPHIKAIHAELQRLHAITAQAISVYPAGACAAELRRLHAELETLPVGYINRGIAPHTKGKTVFHEKPTRNLEERWWSRDEPVFLASQGQAPAQPVDFTTLGAAMRAIQQAIGLIGDPADERMQAVRRVLRGAVVVAEDSEDIPAQPAPPADSVLYDPKAVLDVFNSARAGSDKPVGYLRGILAVIAHWENKPEPHRWMVPARADSVQEDAARLDWLLLRISGAEFRRLGVYYSGNARRADVDAARKQGGSHD